MDQNDPNLHVVATTKTCEGTDHTVMRKNERRALDCVKPAFCLAGAGIRNQNMDTPDLTVLPAAYRVCRQTARCDIAQ